MWQWRASPRSSRGPPPAAGYACSGPPPLPQPAQQQRQSISILVSCTPVQPARGILLDRRSQAISAYDM